MISLLLHDESHRAGNVCRSPRARARQAGQPAERRGMIIGVAAIKICLNETAEPQQQQHQTHTHTHTQGANLFNFGFYVI